MLYKKISIFISGTIDVFVLWLEECLKPLLTYSFPLAKEEPKNLPVPKDDFFHNNIVDDDADIIPFPQKPNLTLLDGLSEKYVDYDPNSMDEDVDFESGRIIMVTLPWGQLVPVPFTGEQWEMVHAAAKESEEPVHKVVEDIIQQRYETAMYMTDDLMMGNLELDEDDPYTDTDE